MLLRNNQHDDREFSIYLTVQLEECVDLDYCSHDLENDDYVSGDAFKVTEFKLKIYDPCKTTSIIFPKVGDLHSLCGYTV